MSKNGQGITGNRSLNYKIALTGIFGALCIVLSITPLGYITIGGLIAITIMHIPVILVTELGGLVPGLGVGLIFGITSLVRSVTSGAAANPFFLNPMVSIVPRLLIPVFTWIFVKLLDMIPKMPKVISGTIGAAIGTFTNTFFVMGSIYIFYGKDLVAGMASALSGMGFSVESLTGINGFFAILFCTLMTNGFWEIAGACIITFAVLGSIYLFKNRKSKLSKLEDETKSE